MKLLNFFMYIVLYICIILSHFFVKPFVNVIISICLWNNSGTKQMDACLKCPCLI